MITISPNTEQFASTKIVISTSTEQFMIKHFPAGFVRMSERQICMCELKIRSIHCFFYLLNFRYFHNVCLAICAAGCHKQRGYCTKPGECR